MCPWCFVAFFLPLFYCEYFFGCACSEFTWFAFVSDEDWVEQTFVLPMRISWRMFLETWTEETFLVIHTPLYLLGLYLICFASVEYVYFFAPLVCWDFRTQIPNPSLEAGQNFQQKQKHNKKKSANGRDCEYVIVWNLQFSKMIFLSWCPGFATESKRLWWWSNNNFRSSELSVWKINGDLNWRGFLLSVS